MKTKRTMTDLEYCYDVIKEGDIMTHENTPSTIRVITYVDTILIIRKFEDGFTLELSMGSVPTTKHMINCEQSNDWRVNFNNIMECIKYKFG